MNIGTHMKITAIPLTPAAIRRIEQRTGKFVSFANGRPELRDWRFEENRKPAEAQE